LKERDYYGMIKSWLEEKGYRALIEWVVFPLAKVIPDIVAIDPDFSEITTIEVKLNSFKKGFWQAFTDMTFSDYVYLAFPERYAYYVIKRYLPIIKKYKIGIIALTPKPKILIKASESDYLDENLKREVLLKARKLLEQDHEGGRTKHKRGNNRPAKEERHRRALPTTRKSLQSRRPRRQKLIVSGRHGGGQDLSSRGHGRKQDT